MAAADTVVETHSPSCLKRMRLGLHQTSAVVAAPLLRGSPTEPATGLERFVAHARHHEGRLPRFADLAGGITASAPLWAITVWHALVT